MRRLLVCAVLALSAPGLAGQGYRLRLDSRFQTVAFRGVVMDSIPATETVTGSGGGPATPDGYAVTCSGGSTYCTFFRPGSARHGAPLATTADLTAWGFGLPGLSVHLTGRVGVDFGNADAWPGTDPAVQLLVGYAEYARQRATVRLGRQVTASRLGYYGFDGAGLTLRDEGSGIEVAAFGGRGLARGAAIPVTSPALNPLDDFQPRERQLVAGATATWTTARVDLHADYLREVDPRSDYFVSERLGVEAAVRPNSGVHIEGGADYDLAAGWWGSAELSGGYAVSGLSASVGVRRYRPHFDLWTIWGAFSPVPYHAVHAEAEGRVSAQLRLRARGEHYVFDDADVATPLVRAESNGSRWEVGTTLEPRDGWLVDAGYHREYGPGAAAVGLDASVTWAPPRAYRVSVYGSSLDRPLEFRFSEAALQVYGAMVEWTASDRLRADVGLGRYTEHRRRPDAAAFDWNQWRLTARVVLQFGRGADLSGLPPAVTRMPGGRAGR